MSAASVESAIVDALDRAIIRALQISPRAPFRLFAEVLDTSEQTVARRYRRLHRAGLLRVTAVVDPTSMGQSNWTLRVQCRPSGSASLAQALARRDDVSWVLLTGGGSEVLCVLRARTEQARDDLLMQRLPRTAPVLAVTASVVLHNYVGGNPDDWTELSDALDPASTVRLQEWAARDSQPDSDPAEITTLSAADLAMFDVLVRDGRASYAALAAAAGLGEARTARRLRALLDRRVAYLDVDIAAAAFGFHTPAYLWLSVTPAALADAGAALAGEPEVAYAGAISGTQNLAAAVMCRDLPALYEFVTTRVGAIAGVQTMEISPIVRTVKQAGALLDGNRLAIA